MSKLHKQSDGNVTPLSGGYGCCSNKRRGVAIIERLLDAGCINEDDILTALGITAMDLPPDLERKIGMGAARRACRHTAREYGAFEVGLAALCDQILRAAADPEPELPLASDWIKERAPTYVAQFIGGVAIVADLAISKLLRGDKADYATLNDLRRTLRDLAGFEAEDQSCDLRRRVGGDV
jgi:hypothetical protein